MRFRLIPLPLVLLLASGMLFANGETVLLDPAWSILENAEIAYEKGDLGEALAACEDARQLHSETMLTYEKKLHTAVTPTVMKRTGGTIPEIRTMMADRNENEAAAILDSVLSVHDAKYFDNSIEKLMNWLTVRTAYPEADMLCGAIYSRKVSMIWPLNITLLPGNNVHFFNFLMNVLPYVTAWRISHVLPEITVHRSSTSCWF